MLSGALSAASCASLTRFPVSRYGGASWQDYPLLWRRTSRLRRGYGARGDRPPPVAISNLHGRAYRLLDQIAGGQTKAKMLVIFSEHSHIHRKPMKSSCFSSPSRHNHFLRRFSFFIGMFRKKLSPQIPPDPSTQQWKFACKRRSRCRPSTSWDTTEQNSGKA